MNITVLGAGLAGLSTAYHLDKDYEIYEAQPEAGGLCRSVKENGFVIDYGPHLFFSKNEYVGNIFNTLLKTNRHLLQSHSGQYSFGTYLQYPYNVNLYGAPIKIIKECISEYVNARKSRNKKKVKTYHDWCLYNFGKGYARNFMLPYIEKMWTVKPIKLTTDWIGNRILTPTLDQILEGALHRSEKQLNYITTFQYPLRGGISAFVESLANKLKPIYYNKRVVRIDLKGRKITFQDGTSSYYEKVVSTIPLPEMIKIIAAVPPSIRDAAKHLINNSVMIVNLGIERSDLSEFQWIYYDGDEPFYRIHFPSMLSGFNAPKKVGVISAEIAYSRYRPLIKGDLIELTITHLRKVGILKFSDNIIYKNMTDLKYAYVIYDHNRKACVNKIRDYLRKNNIETCGRFGEWAYLWMDQSILSGKRAAEAIKET